MKRREFLGTAVTSAIALGASWSSVAEAAEPAIPAGVKPVAPPLPLSIAIAAANGKTAQTEAWVDAQIEAAQGLYNPFGVSFRKAETRRLAPAFMRLETRGDRDGLAAHLQPGRLNVFVVASLRDVDDPSLYRMGVHWAPNGDLKRQYVIVSGAARKTTLAHEIGHYFTLQHTQVVDNLMSYSRNGGTVFLNAKQKADVTTSVRTHVARKLLVP
ncbi:MAG: hypothetical protein U0441_32080 [Polyangiaceae bacterium]